MTKGVKNHFEWRGIRVPKRRDYESVNSTHDFSDY